MYIGMKEVCVSVGLGVCVLASCQEKEVVTSSADEVKEPVVEKAEPRVVDTLKVGMEVREALNLLEKVGYEDITERVGILAMERKEDKDRDVGYAWLIVPNNTCVAMKVSSAKGEDFHKIERMIVGELGKGYGGKVKWSWQKKTEPKELVIPVVKKEE